MPSKPEKYDQSMNALQTNDTDRAARFYGATFTDSKVTARCCRSLLHEVHVTVPLQEFKIAYPVKIILRAKFHFRVLDDLG